MSLDTLIADFKQQLKSALSAHVNQLKGTYPDLYGYAILPGDEFSVSHLVAAFNREGDLEARSHFPGVSETYYRFSVDEWKHYDQTGLGTVTPIIQELVDRYGRLNPTDDWEGWGLGKVAPRVEAGLLARLHSVLLEAMFELKKTGVFRLEQSDLFLAIWISDSHASIMFDSIARLNSDSVVTQFNKEFLT